MGFHLLVWSSGRSPPPTPPIRPHLSDQKIHSSAKTTNLRAQDALWRVCNHCRLTLQSSAVRRGRWGERHKSGLGWVCFATQTGAINELPRHAPPGSCQGTPVLGRIQASSAGNGHQLEVGPRQPFRLAAGGVPYGAKHHGLDLTLEVRLAQHCQHCTSLSADTGFPSFLARSWEEGE